jgi:hypothetical protein
VKNRGFLALEAPPRRENHEIYIRSIYKQNEICCQVKGALDRRQCARVQPCVLSFVCSTFDRNALDRKVCDRSHLTTQVLHSIIMRSIASSALDRIQCARAH